MNKSTITFLLLLSATTNAFQVTLPPQALLARSASATATATNTQLSSYAATATADMASSSASSSSSFGDRMRKAALAGNTANNKNKKTPTKTKTNGLSLLPNMYEATSIDEYGQLVADEAERLTVVRFYAPWCRACKASEPFYRQLAKQNPNLKFVQVSAGLESTKSLITGLGIPSLPYGQIFLPSAGIVEERSMSRKNFVDFNAIVKSYVNGECQLSDDIDQDTGLYSSPYKTPTTATANKKTSTQQVVEL